MTGRSDQRQGGDAGGRESNISTSLVQSADASVPPEIPHLSATSYAGQAGEAALGILTMATAVATQPRDAAFSVIRLIRAATARRFSQQLREEWDSYVALGKIKPDYADTDQARMIFADTLEEFEDANFDEEQLELLRKLFLAAASETSTNRHDMMVREYVQVGRSLSTSEIRILAAYHRYLPEWREVVTRTPLHSYSLLQAHEVAKRNSGLEYIGLIERHERYLIEKGLVRPERAVNPGMANVDRKLHRLTDFGFAFCEFISSYERLKE